jgi:hypothetical protein
MVMIFFDNLKGTTVWLAEHALHAYDNQYTYFRPAIKTSPLHMHTAYYLVRAHLPSSPEMLPVYTSPDPSRCRGDRGST